MNSRLAPAGLAVCLMLAAAPATAVDLTGTAMDPKYCEAIVEQADRIAPHHTISFDETNARAGSPITVRWNAVEQRPRLPAYLIISFDGPVRFSGEGYYPLAAGARAPFEVEYGQDGTRAIVPLQQSTLARHGSFDVIPLTIGALNASAAFVSATGCGEHVLNDTKITFDVAPGIPQIQLADAFDLSSPDERHVSPDGMRHLDIYAGRWRLTDAGTGNLLAEREGITPRFSPTGRFLASLTISTVDLVDTVDGSVVVSFDELDPDSIAEIGWANHDSFIVFGANRGGGAAIHSTLVENRKLLTSFPSCNACDAFGSTVASIDLQNNFVVVGDLGQGETDLFREVSSITGDATYDTLSIIPGSESYTDIGDFLVKTSNVVPPRPLVRLTDLEGLVLTMLSGNAGRRDEFHAQDGLDDIGRALWSAALEAYLPPEIVEPGAAGSDGVQMAELAVPRGAVAFAHAARDRDTAMKRRLGEFGIPLYAHERLVELQPEAFASLGEVEGDFGTTRNFAMPGDSSVVLVESALSFDCGNAVPAASDTSGIEVHVGLLNWPAAWTHRTPGGTLTLVNGVCAGGSGGNINGTLFLHDSRFPGEVVNLDANFAVPRLQYGTSCETSMSGCPFKTGVAHDRYLLIWSSEARAVAAYDLNARHMLASLFDLPSGTLMNDVSISPDGKTLVQANSDGTFSTFDIASRPGTYLPESIATRAGGDQDFANWTEQVTPILSGAYRDDEIVVWTQDGTYDATYEGASQVSLRLPGVTGRYAISQFERLLRQPGLAQDVIERRYESREADIVAPPTISARIARENSEIAIDLSQRFGGDLREVLVFQDGLLTDRLPAEAKREIKARVSARPAGRNVTVVAVDRTGLLSLPLGVELAPVTGEVRKLVVVAIGVDTYANSALSTLTYAGSDARLFASTTGAGSPLYGEIQQQLLVDGDASPETVRAALDRALADAGPETDVMFFFAGHGVRDQRGSLYLALAGSDPADLANTAVSWDALSDRLSATTARISIFLDACHSGLAGQGLFATNDAAVDALLSANTSSIAVFAASKGREQSLETPSAGGGVFTSALARILGAERQKHDADGDGIVSASEAFHGLKRQVVADTRGVQTPWFARNDAIGDFPLF